MESAVAGGPNQVWGGIIYVGNRASGKITHAVFRHSEIGVQIRKGLVAEEMVVSDSLGYDQSMLEAIRNRPTGPVTISNCTIDHATFNGIVAVGVDSNVVIEDNFIEGCSSGIACEDSARPVIHRNIVLGSYSTGIMCSGASNPDIYECTVVGAITAGIICANQSNPTIDRCVVAKSGIGISATASNPRIKNSTIADNQFSGIIAYEGAAPTLDNSNVRGNGLAAIDNRSSGDVRADRCWWGFLLPESSDSGPVIRRDGYTPFLDGPTRRFLQQPADESASGRVLVTNTLKSPSIDAPGTPDSGTSISLAQDPDMTIPFESGEVTNNDTIYIELVAVDESPYVEDQAPIIISTSTGDPEGTQQVLRETGPSTATYRGQIVASLVAGDPNLVVQVQNGDMITVESGTRQPLTAQIEFVSMPPRVRRLRVNNTRRGARLVDPTPTFTWEYFDNENDPQAGTQLQLGTEPEWLGEPLWNHQEAGQRLSFTHNGENIERGRTYYVRVRANDGYNWGPWAETSFHMNIAPPTPTLAFPEDDALVKSEEHRPALAVNNVTDVDGDPVSYIFEAYHVDSTFNKPGNQAGGQSWRPTPVPEDAGSDHTVWSNMPALIENTKVFWRAKATDGLEESEWSQPRSFFLDTYDDEPQPFAMLRPREATTGDTVRSLTPRFEWEHTYDPDRGDEIYFVLKYGMSDNLRAGAPGVEVLRLPVKNENPQYYQVPFERILRDNTLYWWTVSAEQDGSTVMLPNTLLTPPKQVWRVMVDMGADPPYIHEEFIPEIVMTEDTPYRLVLVDSLDFRADRGYRAIHDADNEIEELTVSARGSRNITASVTDGGREKIIMLTPRADWFGGPEAILLSIVDTDERTGTASLQVRVAPSNDGPTMRPIADMATSEDEPLLINLYDYVDDIDNTKEEMAWSARFDRDKLTVGVRRGTMRIQGVRNFNGGPVPLVIAARDPGGLVATTSVNVTITPVNDRPEVTEMPDIVLREDETASVSLDLYAEDPDNGDRELIWTADAQDPLIVRIDGNTRRATVRAPENWGGGERRVTFTVRDPDGLQNQVSATVRVEAVNDAPTISSIPDQSFNEDEELVLDLDPFVSDVDNAKREISWQATRSTHLSSRIDAGNRRLVLTAPGNWYGGPESITLTASDPGGLSARRAVNVRVRSVPEAPQFTAIPAVNINEDNERVIDLRRHLSDPDHDIGQLTVNVNQPQNVRAELDRSTWRLRIFAPANWHGSPETVTLEAIDPDNERARMSFPVTIASVNDPPVLSTVGEVRFKEDESTSLSLSALVTDADHSPSQMTWQVSGNRQVQVTMQGAVAAFRAAENWKRGPSASRSPSAIRRERRRRRRPR